jgi:YVTN family beta-propeller protein
VAVVSTSAAEITAKVPVGLLPTSAAVSADGTTVYVTSAYGYSLAEIDTATNSVTFTLVHVGIYPFSVVSYH